MNRNKKYLSLLISTLAIVCCFSCHKSKSIKESTTIIKTHNIENNDEIGFLYKGEDNFTVDWGDNTTEDIHNSTHIYQNHFDDLTITVKGNFSEFSFANEYGPFEANEKLTEITIGEGITNIPTHAFNGCGLSEGVVIPKSVKTVGGEAFNDCNAIIYCKAEEQPSGWSDNWLTGSNRGKVYWDYVDRGSDDTYSYVVRNKGTIINQYKSLEPPADLIIPDKLGGKDVVAIDNFVFSVCESFVSVTLPKTMRSIGDSAFDDCTKLEKIINTQNLSTIGTAAFLNCYKLKGIELNSATSIQNRAFDSCFDLTSITLSNNLTNIGASAFHGCQQLREISLCKSVKTIGEIAFSGCNELTIYCEHEDKPDGWSNTWNPDGRLCYWDCSSHGSEKNYDYIVTSEGAVITKYNGSEQELIVPSKLGGKDVVKIYSRAFSGNDHIVYVTLPKTLKSIEEDAFRACSQLKVVSIQNGVTFIGTYAFADCAALESVNIPKSAVSVGALAFLNCYERLTIYCGPESKPEGWADNWNPDGRPCVWSCLSFGIKDNIKYIVTDEGAVVVGSAGFGEYNNYVISDKFDGANVVRIEDRAFYADYSFTSIKIPKTLKNIGDKAFDYRWKVVTIDLTAFTNCHGDLPTAHEDAFTNVDWAEQFLVASHEMEIAFMLKGGGWSLNAYSYKYPATHS